MKRMRVALFAAVPVVAITVAVLARPAGAQDAPLAPGGSYHALSPARILDTRSGLGAAKGPTQSVTVGTAGVAGIPSSGVAAVAINITVIGAVGGGNVVAYPAGASRPAAPIAYYAAGQTVGAMTIVGVNSAGKFSIYSTAQAQVVADVAGYFTTAQAAITAGLYNSVGPARIVNTTKGLGGGALGPRTVRTIRVTGVAGVPASGVSAVVVNLGVAAPTATGYLIAYPAGIAPPPVSSISFIRGETRSNRAIVPVGKDGKISIYNAAGTTHLVVDVNGYFADGAGSYYVPTTPYRLVDGRTSCGTVWRAPYTTAPLGVTVDASSTTCGAGRAPSQWSVAPSRAVWLTLSAVQASSAGGVVAYPSGLAKPGTSELTAAAGRSVANSGPIGVGTSGAIQIYSAAGFQATGSSLLVDISGYFLDAPRVPTSQGIWAWGVPGVRDAFQNTPIQGVRAFAGWSGLALALLDDGTVAGWSLPTFGGYHLFPNRKAVSAGTNVVQIAGGNTTYLLHSDGTVRAWGANSYGEIGDGTHTSGPVFVEWGSNVVSATGGKTAIDNVVSIGAAANIGYAVTADGAVWAWGRNNTGQLGNGTRTDSYSPVQVNGLTGVRSIAGGSYLSYAIDADGHLWRWGGADLVPHRFDSACAVGVSVVAGSSGGWELCDDGTVWQLDHQGSVVYGAVSYPRHLPSLTHITAIASAPGTAGPGAGVQALDTAGKVWRYDQPTDSFSPVYGLTGVTGIGSVGQVAYAAAG